jgi:hypothetical protein
MVRRAVLLSVTAVATALLSLAAPPNPQEIVGKSVAATKADWAQAPKYSYLERDVDSKRHAARMSKTYRVLMIDGSPYNLVTAIHDQPVSPDEKMAEQRKLQKEIEKRQNDSEREREKRIAKYDKGNEHDHQMLQEMIDAFEFHLAGEAQVDGHDCWVMDAESKPGYEPSDHEGRVLKGMKGRLWIDKASYQWVKVHAEVVKPVSFYGFLARVGPGTEFDLEQEPVADGVWMPKAFNVRVRASALGFFNENSDENETYRDYQPMPRALALLPQSTK